MELVKRWTMTRSPDGRWIVADPECCHNVTCGGSVSCWCQTFDRRSASTAADFLHIMQEADDLELDAGRW